jgi:hypothetical protein
VQNEPRKACIQKYFMHGIAHGTRHPWLRILTEPMQANMVSQ